MTVRKPIPPGYWVVWMSILAAALVVFYGILTPLWMLLRAVAWVTEHPRLRGPAPVSEDTQTAPRFGR